MTQNNYGLIIIKMPRVSVRRLFVYAIYTVVATSLVMLALHVQQQNPLWLRVVEQSSGPGGYYQHNSKEVVDEEAAAAAPPPNFVVIGGDEETDSENSTADALRHHGLPWYIKNDGYRPTLGDPVVRNIWPGRLNGDRIEQQLMIPAREPNADEYSAGANNNGALKKIFLPNGLGSWQTKNGQSVFLDQKCPVDRCSLTGKRDDAATADAIMFKGDYLKKKNIFILSRFAYRSVDCEHSWGLHTKGNEK